MDSIELTKAKSIKSLQCNCSLTIMAVSYEFLQRTKQHGLKAFITESITSEGAPKDFTTNMTLIHKHF